MAVDNLDFGNFRAWICLQRFGLVLCEPLKPSFQTIGFYIPTVSIVVWFKIAQESSASLFTCFNMRLCVVDKEEFLILGVSLDPLAEFWLSDEPMVGRRTEIARFFTQKQLLEVSVIEDVRVLTPTSERAFFVSANKS